MIRLMIILAAIDLLLITIRILISKNKLMFLRHIVTLGDVDVLFIITTISLCSITLLYVLELITF